MYDIEQNFKKNKLNDDPKIKLLKYPNKIFRFIKFSEISDKLFILSNVKKKIVVLLREFFFFNEKKTIILGVFSSLIFLKFSIPYIFKPSKGGKFYKKFVNQFFKLDRETYNIKKSWIKKKVILSQWIYGNYKNKSKITFMRKKCNFFCFEKNKNFSENLFSDFNFILKNSKTLIQKKIDYYYQSTLEFYKNISDPKKLFCLNPFT